MERQHNKGEGRKGMPSFHFAEYPHHPHLHLPLAHQKVMTITSFCALLSSSGTAEVMSCLHTGQLGFDFSHFLMLCSEKRCPHPSILVTVSSGWNEVSSIGHSSYFESNSFLVFVVVTSPITLSLSPTTPPFSSMMIMLSLLVSKSNKLCRLPPCSLPAWPAPAPSAPCPSCCALPAAAPAGCGAAPAIPSPALIMSDKPSGKGGRETEGPAPPNSAASGDCCLPASSL
mmetsp:Transcript_31873/g.83211  ORF Transcript_31873/g.83211 Transcript_31873/m.83211 type:complete len:229 (+) Transcript_31873:420-1106(+)